MNLTRFPVTTLIVVMLCWVSSRTTVAQDSSNDSNLLLRQAGVAERYERLEELLLRLADVEAVENPERAALLRQAAKQSREKFVLQQLRNASDSLRVEKFSDALTNQDLAQKGLAEILTLLTSEDRASRLRDEKKRIAEQIKSLKRIERAQRSTRARTENGSDLDRLQKEQESITKRGEKLGKEIAEDSGLNPEDQTEEGEEPDAESNAGEEPDAKQRDTDQQEENQSKEEDDESDQETPKKTERGDDPAEKMDPKDGAKQSEKDSASEEQSSKSQKPSDSKPSESKPQSKSQPSDSKDDSQQSEGQQQQTPKTPEQRAQQELDQAIKRMQKAEDQLEKSKRDEAVQEQIAAEENLRKAIDQLEQILRQMREEEMQRELARLESRLKKMAAMQTKVLDDTAELSATPTLQRSRQTDLKAGDLAFEQKKITVEADRAMLLLREEGSSVAFPEVVAQIREDSDRIAQRLGKTQIDAVTQGIQQDVLAAIEEMVKALQQAQRDLEKKQQEGKASPQQQGSPGDQPLVDSIAELKLIRTMESRIKSTTQRYSGLLQSDEGSAQELLPLVKNLSDRQSRLYKITRDLVMKRNK